MMMVAALLAFAVAIVGTIVALCLAQRWGFLDDPWPDTPGARNDRRVLLDEGRAE